MDVLIRVEKKTSCSVIHPLPTFISTSSHVMAERWQPIRHARLVI